MKAIFLVGGPGSGKNVLINNVLNKYSLKEYKLEQLESIGYNLNRSIIISTNADNFNGIKHSKELLESNGYKTSMIFVDVSNEVSMSRISNRAKLSEKTILNKLKECKKNCGKFSLLFDDFIVWRNDYIQEDFCHFEEIFIFCESFINLNHMYLFQSEGLNKKIIDKSSIKKKLLKKISPVDVVGTTKVPADRIGDEFGVRNSGIGFPSTVGAFYGESYAEYSPELPAFTSDSTPISRSIPPTETYSSKIKPKENINRKTISKIKSVAKLCWDKRNEIDKT